MTLQPIPSEFPYVYEENFVFFFMSMERSNMGLYLICFNADVDVFSRNGSLTI
jgi:hypothetical protein